MDSTGAWSGDQLPAFGQQFDTSQNGEDWEDWLRWDPAAEATSPEDGATFHSGSSKNDSPSQDAVLPFNAALFGKGAGDDTLAPPLIFGEDSLDFSAGPLPSDEAYLFGASNVAASGFDFDPAATFLPLQPGVPKIDTNAAWTLPSNAPPQEVSLSALSNEYGQQFPAAGPALSSTHGLHFSPESSSHNRTSGSSISNSPTDAPKKRGGRKRKAEVQLRRDEEEHEEESVELDADGQPTKTSHNVIEKRYRNNLNDKIMELRSSVPSLRAMGRTNGGDDSEDLGGLTPAHKLNKATVMAKATEYIKHLEKRNKTMSDEMAALQARLATVEAAIGKTRDRQSSMSNSPPSGTMRPRQTSASSQNGAQGFLNVPQDQTRYGQPVMQQQYMQPQQQAAYARAPNAPAEAQNQPQYVYGRGGGVMNKVMMGAMAGIMVMEGFTEQQQDDTRQLFATPTALFKRGMDAPLPTSPAAFARQAALPLLKVFCVIGALIYLIAPLLAFPHPPKQKTRPAVRLPQVPSLASPVEVRRKAWLTAMQTVYVPKHFLLEVAAVTTKSVKLSLRRLVGTETWNSLTGANKEDEAARIKAWDIAVDAQLAGGDAEVSYHRLLLTLMASGTLPDSPTRLMQKAVHFRVFFWEVANAGYGNMVGFKKFTERVGKFYWDSARKLQKELAHAKAQGRPTDDEDVDLLPDHLASLLELECDDVLSDEMIQRAWNLAWDKPSAYKTTANAARDSVVEDHAIRSPLDALAAWYANMTIDDTLLDTLGEHPSNLDMEYYVGLAVSIAPPASATQVRALATKAVLSNPHREANIIAALEALPVTSPGAGTMNNLINHAPAAPDVHLALTIAKLLSLLSPSAPSTAQARAHDMIANLHFEPSCFTLLTAVATYRLLRLNSTPDRDLPQDTAHGFEDMAASLRLWIGTSAGRRAGLEQADCGRIVDLCLGVAKKVGGWDAERDSGYGSAEGSPVRTRAEVAIP
ncbi:hypothetical protein LTR36_001556 [Oleoguttula mirabilis]|uniref:BHLH domain-containing protein n=1 Tax=Oleoguttula mirabilis TaxID=1507867 RepID=A0AAV9JNV7_9PEZI|nr:hypothetical protein LTR36_001556 [Oleoguttula mirabilis]